ncbi:uncharacterized protein RVIR1_09930 [Candidatus Rickettsiella viridis]|uniref:Toxin n=1 Tax=Candidatus Rickettsiella viridis TaxID=676208 RepID=A0A2Z5UUY9_9COXI|nr:toxin [Candidatus Rickettsiella viridis]BBB15466.1 uncharacterized protein RVIR1_09930 [Candidatus Rickettsiella viridis]
MKSKIIYRFDPEKNTLLINKRGISFEEIISILEATGPIDVISHPNIKKYPKQEMYVIEIDSYIYLVPFVREKNSIFLKTVFPSRKATKKYLSEVIKYV